MLLSTASRHVCFAGAPKGKKEGNKFGKAPERVKDYNVLFVGNVPWELTRSSVADLFREFKPKFVRMFDKPGTRQHKGFAHIHFADEAAVDKCVPYFCLPPGACN
jgi:RNA recognition motif-containing protein